MLALQNGNFSSRRVGVGGVESTFFLTIVDIVVIKFQVKWSKKTNISLTYKGHRISRIEFHTLLNTAIH